MKKLAIVLFQLGGPENQEAVEPFLYNLFCDPDIINFPGSFLARKPLAKWISRSRAKIAKAHYAEIGGGSPIRRLTEDQARALELALQPWVDAKVLIAMRYWNPLTSEALEALARETYDELVLLPLYPHYSFATTKSSLKEWKRETAGRRKGQPARVIESFFDHPLYIDALCEPINAKLAQLKNPQDVFLVFSAHGLPMKLVESGDPYPTHIEATKRLVLARGGWRNPNVLCFQSRVGPQKWLEPSLTQTIEWLAHEGIKRMMVIPLSFVTDHIETLHEIDIEAREEAKRLGIEDFSMMPALNDSPLLIRALADLVLKATGFDQGVNTPPASQTAARAG